MSAKKAKRATSVQGVVASPSSGKLSKTARASVGKDKSIGDAATGHDCATCGRGIKLRDYLSVRTLRLSKLLAMETAHYHRACYGVL